MPYLAKKYDDDDSSCHIGCIGMVSTQYDSSDDNQGL
jgi:hypothetical protein